MLQIRIPSDVFICIFLELTTNFEFTSDMNKLSSFFYKKSKDKKYSNLFNGIIFDSNRLFPYCCKLDAAVDKLLYTETLIYDYINENRFILFDKSITDDIRSLFSNSELKLIHEIGKELTQFLINEGGEYAN
jgi:hypothetical protein